MYKVTKRDCPMFGIGPYICEFICDTASDITTLPTSISEGTGGRTAYDNQKCASGSIAIIAENGSESKQYMLNNQDIWCPYSIAVGNSGGGSSGSPITIDFALSETSENPVANKVIVTALNEKANKTDIPTKVSQLENDSGYLTEHPHINEKLGPTTITSLRFGDSFDSIEQIVTDGNGHIQEVHGQTLTLPNILIENSLDIHSSGLLTNKTITAALNEKADTTHTHSADDVGADASGSAASALKEAKAYTDSEIAALDTTIATKANKTDIPTELPANGGNADTVSSLRTSSNYRDIFSTSLDNTHPGWNRKCYAYGQSNDSTLDTYIENAPETGLNGLWYEVETIGTSSRAYQIAYGCYKHQQKSFIRYMHDSSWSGWKEISTAPIGVMTYTITFSEVTWERSYNGQGKYYYAPDALNVNKILSVSIDQWSGLLPDEWVIPYIRTDKQFAIFSNVGKTSGVIGIRIAYI